MKTPRDASAGSPLRSGEPPAGSDPSSAEAQFKLARVWQHRGQLRRAIKSYDRALSQDPDHVSAILGKVESLTQLGKPDLALGILSVEVSRLPNEALIHKALADGHAARGDLADLYQFYRLQPGPEMEARLSPTDVICCCVVRNELNRLPFFLDYYRQLGIDAFFFVDNASTDGTAEYLKRQPDALVWSSDLSFDRANFGSAWFELILRKHGVNHWCLIVDADELLCYRDSESFPLEGLCRRLSSGGKRAFPALLLDMYSKSAIGEAVCRSAQDWREVCPYFDRQFFHTKHLRGGPFQNQPWYFGGARRRVFGDEQGYLLSKVPLLRYRPDCVLAGGQHWTNLPSRQISVESGCLLHFKYLSTFVDRVPEEVGRQQHYGDAVQYQQYDRKLKAHGRELTLYDPQCSVLLDNSQQLVDAGVIQPRLRSVDPAQLGVSQIESVAPNGPPWSVMISVYDRTEYLDSALRSVLTQSSDQMQIEVVCDSPDPSIIAELQRITTTASDGTVPLRVTGHRLGQPRVFDRCIQLSEGELVHILHDDDCVREGFYRSLQAGFETDASVGAAFCRHLLVEPDAKRPSAVEQRVPGIIEDWLFRIGVSCRPAFSSMVVRRGVYEALGGFSPDVGSAFDWEMWKRIAVFHSVWYEPQILVECRRDGSTLTDELLESGGQIADSARAIEFSKRYLPAYLREEISEWAADYYSGYALELAREQLRQGHSEAAAANLEQALATYPCDETRRRISELTQGA